MTPVPACLPRSREALLAAVRSVDPEHAPDLQRRDVDGDGQAETWCNVALRRMLAWLGLIIPPLLANDLVDWLAGEGAFAGKGGPREGWSEVFDPKKALELIARGFPVVIVLKEPGHGHCALGVPEDKIVAGKFPELRIAQAGRHNYNNAPVAYGFGSKPYRIFFHS